MIEVRGFLHKVILMKHTLALLLTSAALICAPVANAADMSEEEIKKLALEAIMENPQIIMDAVALLREREEEAKQEAATVGLRENKDTLFNDPNAIVMGNPDGDVTLVEFFDYNCGYCKRAAAGVQALIKADPQLRVVMREWPILSEGSVVAARASLAARKQGKYEPFHWALMAMPRADEASVMKAAESVGIDTDQLKTDMADAEVETHIAQSRALAEALGFSGTPSFVAGDQLIPGYVPQEQLEELIAGLRAK